MQQTKTPIQLIPFIIRISSLLWLLGHPLTPSIQADNTPINLWRIDREEGRGSVYFFGSIHIGDKDLIASIPKPVLDAFDKSKVFVVELDVNYDYSDFMQNIEVLKLSLALLTPISIPLVGLYLYFYKSINPSMYQKLNFWGLICAIWLMGAIYLPPIIYGLFVLKDDLDTIWRACRTLGFSWFKTLMRTYIGFPSHAFLGGRERVARILLDLPLVAIFSPASHYFGVEQFLKRRMYKDASKVMEELETLQIQLEVNANIRPKEKSLAKITSQLSQLKKAMQELRNEWETGDMEKIDAVNRYQQTFYEDNYTEDILISRNYQMVDEIIQRYLQTPTDSSLKNPLYDGDIFITVGVSHFPGKEGMIALLRKKGYTVHQLTKDGAIYVPPKTSGSQKSF